MAQTPMYIEDSLSDVVDVVSTTLGLDIYFTFGPVAEIINKMVAMTKQPSGQSRYPLIALLTDFPEEMGESTNIYSRATVNLIIANWTNPKIMAEKRLTDNFKTVLMPIYEQLKTSLRQSNLFDIEDEREIRHTMYKRYNFGRSQFFSTGTGADFIDAVEIQNMELSLKSHNCLILKT